MDTELKNRLYETIRCYDPIAHGSINRLMNNSDNQLENYILTWLINKAAGTDFNYAIDRRNVYDMLAEIDDLIIADVTPDKILRIRCTSSLIRDVVARSDKQQDIMLANNLIEEYFKSKQYSGMIAFAAINGKLLLMTNITILEDMSQFVVKMLPHIINQCFAYQWKEPYKKAAYALCADPDSEQTTKYLEECLKIWNDPIKQLDRVLEKMVEAELNDLNEKKTSLEGQLLNLSSRLMQSQADLRSVKREMAGIELSGTLEEQKESLKEAIEYAKRILPNAEISLHKSASVQEMSHTIYDGYFLMIKGVFPITQFDNDLAIRINNSYMPDTRKQKLFEAIFVDKTVTLLTKVNMGLNLQNFQVGSLSLYSTYEPNILPHTHLQHYHCWGNTYDEILCCQQDKNYIQAITQMLYAAQSINLTDSSVTERLLGTLLEYDEQYMLKNNETGVMLTVKEVLDEITETDAEDD